MEPLNARSSLFSHVGLSRGYSVNLTGSSLNNPFDDTSFNPASAIGVSDCCRDSAEPGTPAGFDWRLDLIRSHLVEPQALRSS